MILCMVLFAMPGISSIYSQSAINSTGIGASINSTTAYINKVNQSGYLVFYPQLSQAYGYLNQAKNQSKANLTESYFLLAKARASAYSQQQSLAQNERYSLYALVLISVFLAVLLYVLMAPYRARRNVGKRRKS